MPKGKISETKEEGISPRTLHALKDPRCPKPGTVMEKTVKGKVCRVIVRDNGFEYEGKLYETPTTIATLFVHKILKGNDKTRRPGWTFFFPEKSKPAKAGKVGRPRKEKPAAVEPAKTVKAEPAKVVKTEPAKVTKSVPRTVKPAGAPAPIAPPALADLED